MKQIKQLLMSILITFLICNYITAQGGNSFETAVQATFDTNNIADTSYMAQYYYFIPDFTGYVVIGNCGLPGFRGEVEVYDSLEVQINTIDYNCEYQTHVVIPVDSSVRYYICWTLSLIEEGETLNWYLNEYDPEPGELYQTAIPIEVGDTIDIIPIEYSSDIWYKIIPSDDKMISISSCNLGNNLYDIREISAFKDSVYNENIDRWSELEQNCTNGLYLDFPSASGNVYYIRLSYLPEITTAKFTVNARDFESGEICELAEDVQANIEYTISSDQKYHWYTYTPEEDEYRVIGSTIINLSTLNLIIKNDCDCEPDYSTSGCMAVGSFGWAQQLDSAISYYFGWNNLFNESTSWCIYEPTRIIDFQICCQTEPTLIDNVNHTVEITVPDDQDVTNLVPEYVQAGNVEFIVNGESQYSGYDEQDFTNPVKYTVRYINPENNDTISQDWIVTVTKEGTPPGPYDVKSKYLKNPDLAKPLVSGFADFWKNAYDAEHGGFYSYVDREGNITDDIKTIVSQTQDAYSFARAFMVTGDTSYLNYADRALQFMYDHYWDEINGGWYVSVDANGNLMGSDSYNTYKYSFFQHYANLGMVAMADATAGVRFNDQEISGTTFNEQEHWEMLNNSLDVINENLWDDRPDYYGYFYEADLDWSNPHGKGFTPTVDGITLHALYMYLLTKDPFFYTRLEQLTNNIEEHMIPAMDLLELGFPENYDSNWEQPSSLDYIGHMYKTAWCLARAYLVDPQERYREAAKVLMYNLLNNGGYDFNYGGPCIVNDEPVTKLFWEVEQAYTSGMLNYYISNDEDDKNRFLKVADGTIDFFMNHFVDTEYGEVYEMTDREGDVISDQKGHYDKAGYHSTEFAYYAYLYGNLFYKNEPVELYYFINPGNVTQTISLYPLAIEDNNLKIDKVELNGVPFDQFNRDTRTLNIAANEGGIFKVTFSNSKSANSIDEPLTNSNLDVKVYPNPVITSSVIEYTVDKYTDVTINIFDITGKVIHSVENKNVSPGLHHEIIHREDLCGNTICLLQVKTNTQSKIIKLVIID